MKKTGRLTVAQLAVESKIETDDALLILWENGIEEINYPQDILFGQSLSIARKALKIPTKQELTSFPFWKNKFGFSEPQFLEFLKEQNILIVNSKSKLPKGSIRKLKSLLNKKSIKMGNAYDGISNKNTNDDSNDPFVNSVPEIARATTIERNKDKCEELAWKQIGHMTDMNYLTVENVLSIHFALVEDFKLHNDPIDPAGPRTDDLVASAVFRPFTQNGTILKYPTIEMAAAALLHSLIHDHPFHNGNKRTALVALVAFLDENGFTLTCKEEEVFKFVLQAAKHGITEGKTDQIADREVISIAQWLTRNSRYIKLGDRPLPYRKLKQILAPYGCVFEHVKARSKMKITRITTERKGLFGKLKEKELITHTFYIHDGREVRSNEIKELRKDLELDEIHGIDSAAFYENTPLTYGDFIMQYRKTLQRLSKL